MTIPFVTFAGNLENMRNLSTRKPFIRPAVLREILFEAEAPVLAGSVVDNTTVVSTGQDTQAFDFSGSNFNHQWD